MGSGKSTLGRQLAKHLELPFFDLDREIERAAGMCIPDFFAAHGEAAFRRLERETVLGLIEREPRIVLALGGGTVVDRDTRHALLRAGRLLTLSAPLERLVQRVGGGEQRPLLQGADIRDRLQGLLRQRAEAYAECHARVDTSLGTKRDALDRIRDIVERPLPVVVPLGSRTYRVHVGRGLLPEIGGFVTGYSAAGLVTDANVARPWGERVAAFLRDACERVAEVTLEPGEPHKNLASVERIWNAMLDAELDRSSLLVAVGGGVVGDLAGFAAATLLRGVAIGQVPTTLLAMVDSSVGGKTGFDTRHGKNLIGAFHQPRFVVCDIDTLQTLPDRERQAGLAEVVKSAWLDGEASVAQIERDADALRDGDPEATERAVRMSVQLKAGVVTRDEQEAGERALLNLGHTVGHAIEAAGGYASLLHGEAVALGMIAAFRVSRGLGIATPADAERMHALLSRIGLPTDVEAHLEPRTLGYIASDKKRRGDRIRFIAPGAPGAVRIVPLELAKLPSLLR